MRFKIHSSNNSSMVLSYSGASTDEYNPVVLERDTGHPGHVWEFTPEGYIMNSHNKNVITIHHDGSLRLIRPQNAHDQKWRIQGNEFVSLTGKSFALFDGGRITFTPVN